MQAVWLGPRKIGEWHTVVTVEPIPPSRRPPRPPTRPSPVLLLQSPQGLQFRGLQLPRRASQFPQDILAAR